MPFSKFQKPELFNLLLVFVGGSLGSLVRFSLSLVMPEFGDFPAATFTVNVLGSFAIGVLFSALPAAASLRAKQSQLFLGTGLLGGFTTYSTFVLESVLYFSISNWVSIFYIFASIVLGVVCALLGLRVGARFKK